MSTDALMVSRFRPVLQAGVPQTGEPLHAEVLHQLCLADGLLELLEWSGQGMAADPLACMWLGSLRWHRLMTGSYPDGAPEPPSREADTLLADPFRPGGSARGALARGSGGSSLAGLASGEMGYPADPVQPEADDAEALLRVVPIGLVPYLEDQMRLDWAEQAICLTHGEPQLRRRARALAALVFELASGQRQLQEGKDEEQEENISRVLEGADDLTASVIIRQLRAAGSPAPDTAPTPDTALTPDAAQQALRQTVSRLDAQWTDVTAPTSS